MTAQELADDTAIRPHSYVADNPPSVVKKVNLPPDTPILNLATNESSWGASPKVLEAVNQRALSPHRYPDPSSTELREAIGEFCDLDPGRIVCGNGSASRVSTPARATKSCFRNTVFCSFPSSASASARPPSRSRPPISPPTSTTFWPA